MGFEDFQPPEGMFNDFFDILSAELGITLTIAERHEIINYTRQAPGVTLEIILQKIFAIAQKKLGNKLSEEKIKVARKRCDDSRLFRLYREQEKLTEWHNKKPQARKTKERKLTDEEVKHIIKEAEKKLVGNKKVRRDLTEKERRKAEEEFRNSSKVGETAIDRANQALLGVLKVGFAGAVQIVVMQNWGNAIGVQDVNPYHGMATIDQGSRVDLSRGDALGTEARAIVNCIQAGALREDFFNKLNNHLHGRPESLEKKDNASPAPAELPAPESKPPILVPQGADPGKIG